MAASNVKNKYDKIKEKLKKIKEEIKKEIKKEKMKEEIKEEIKEEMKEEIKKEIKVDMIKINKNIIKKMKYKIQTYKKIVKQNEADKDAKRKAEHDALIILNIQYDRQFYPLKFWNESKYKIIHLPNNSNNKTYDKAFDYALSKGWSFFYWLEKYNKYYKNTCDKFYSN